MSPLAIKAIAASVLIVVVIGGWMGLESHYIKQGVAQENMRWLAIEADANAKADKKLAAANEQVRALQAQIDAIKTDLANKQQELHDAQLKSASLESDLRNGVKRMSALVTLHNQGYGAGPVASAGPAGMDQGTEVTADLSPNVAANLERFRINENSAIARLDACIVAYDAIKAASDALGVKP